MSEKKQTGEPLKPITIRVPVSLRDRIKEAAAKDYRDMTSWVVVQILRGLGERPGA